MKKILLRVFLVLLVFAAVVAGTAAYLLFQDPEEGEMVATRQPTMVDSSGKSHLLVVDGNGTSYAVVTDVDGNRYAAEYNGSQIGATVGMVNDQISLSDLPTEPTGEQVVVTNDANSFTGNVSTVQTTAPVTTTAPAQNTDTTTGVAVTDPVVDATQPTTQVAGHTPSDLVPYRIEKYEKIFASCNYLMEITTNDPDLGETPITMALKNGNMYIDTTIEGIKCKMLYVKSNDTMYLIFDEWKKYCKLPEDLMGEDMDMSSMMADFNMADIGEVTISQVDIGGQQLILESYISMEDGSTVNYYFNGEDLVRRDNISSAGVTDSIYVSKFMSDVPDSYFEIPAGYGYLNLSWLDALM